MAASHTCKFMRGSVEIPPRLGVCLGEGGQGPCSSGVPSSHLLVRNDQGGEEEGW